MAYNWLREAYCEYGIVVVFVLARVYVRTKIRGFRRWQADDYLILLALAASTVQLILLRHQYYSPNIAVRQANMSPAEIAAISKVLQYNLGVWTINVILIWTLKTCMVLFYLRVTVDLPQRRFVIWTAYIVAITFVVCILELYLHCLPLKKIWQVVPTPEKVCSTSLVNFYVVGMTNFMLVLFPFICVMLADKGSTDGMLFCIPVPILYRSRLPWRRKLVVGFLVCGGIFVMFATLIRMVVAISQVSGVKGNRRFANIEFALREYFVAFVVVNAPCIKPIFSSKSWLLHPLRPSREREGQHDDHGVIIHCGKNGNMSMEKISERGGNSVDTGNDEKDVEITTKGDQDLV